jgi:hypothetical protein
MAFRPGTFQFFQNIHQLQPLYKQAAEKLGISGEIGEYFPPELMPSLLGLAFHGG